MKLLLWMREPHLARTIAHVLAQRGYESDVAHGLEEVLMDLESGRYDVLLANNHTHVGTSTIQRLISHVALHERSWRLIAFIHPHHTLHSLGAHDRTLLKPFGVQVLCDTIDTIRASQ